MRSLKIGIPKITAISRARMIGLDLVGLTLPFVPALGALRAVDKFDDALQIVNKWDNLKPMASNSDHLEHARSMGVKTVEELSGLAKTFVDDGMTALKKGDEGWELFKTRNRGGYDVLVDYDSEKVAVWSVEQWRSFHGMDQGFSIEQYFILKTRDLETGWAHIWRCTLNLNHDINDDYYYYLANNLDEDLKPIKYILTDIINIIDKPQTNKLHQIIKPLLAISVPYMWLRARKLQ